MSGLHTLRRRVAAGPVGRQARSARRRVAVIRQTRQLRPDHIRLEASGHVVYVDPADRRGRTLVAGLGRGHQPALIALWRQALEVTRPTLVIDVGANYGEFVLNARYAPGARVLAVEANPHVVPILRRSVAAHPDAARIEVLAVLASDTDDGTEVLRVDPTWSGSATTGSAAANAPGTVTQAVARRTLDSLVGPVPAGALVLKADTEGSELAVIGGAREVLAQASAVVALVEFDPGHLRRQGTDPAALFDRLRAIGPCWAVDWDGARRAVTAPPDGATDLLVVSDPATAAALGLPTR